MKRNDGCPFHFPLSTLALPRKSALDMSDPLFYILAPFLLAFGLFAVFLVVSIILKDPARPFRMFGAPPLKMEEQESEIRNQESEEEQGAEETETGTGGRGDAEKNLKPGT